MYVDFRILFNGVMCISWYITVGAVPPEACFAEFNFNDCGRPPTPVVYYWKPGSRCEVAMWKGCLPNTNMFANEYECVSTCVFTVRAMPEDYHAHNEIDGDLEAISISKEFVATTINAGVSDSTETGTIGGIADAGNSTTRKVDVEADTAVTQGVTEADDNKR